ncbi:GNAT family N-acetyltransferase [Microbacterium sp. P05]|uniref:GNAT family N-acetyltransferase n=1 Tax=Microbacterium sp. P05 TaxID=3366948 RepID=UPI0037470EE5
MTEPVFDSPDSALRYGATLLRGEQVALRATTDSDIETLTDWRMLPDWAVLQQNMVRPESRPAIREMFTRWSTNDSPAGVGLSIDNADGTFIGHATLWGAALPTRIARFAIVIGPDFIGRGYGTDATRVMLRYAFEELGVHKVELEAWAYNTRAIRAYEKAGFVREGVRRAAAFHRGAFHDSVLMGVVLEDHLSD